MKNRYIFYSTFCSFYVHWIIRCGNLIRVPARQYAPRRPNSRSLAQTGVLPKLALKRGVGDRDLCRDGSWEWRSVPYKLLAIPAAGLL
jgi:hypothetical protein